jgi:YHS domain-containing protein
VEKEGVVCTDVLVVVIIVIYLRNLCGVKMVKCAFCEEEVDEEKSLKLTVAGKTYHFDSEEHLNKFVPIKTISQTLASVILSKTSAELVAIATGLGGIVYTIIGVTDRALVMDLFSAIAAIVALVIGIEHLRYLKEHNLMRRAILLLGIGILIVLAILVWNFGFRLNLL